MKKILFSAAFLLLMVSSTNAVPYSYRTTINFNYFYSSLAPYGDWIELEPNVVVWRPQFVGRNWSPYNDGRWVYTNYGWHWDSYEPFGWAVYHYGRWFYDDWYGWVWMPGYDWAPAWVEFRYDDVYIGWAPLPPYAEFRPGIGIHFTHDWHHSHLHWHFVSFHYFGHDHVNYYVENPKNNNGLYNRTKYRTNYYERNGAIINNSIDRSIVEKRSGKTIVTRDVNVTHDRNSINRGGSDNRTVSVFRPGEDELRDTQNRRNIEVIKSDRKSSIIAEKIVDRDKNEIRGNIVRKNDTSTRDNERRVTNYRSNNESSTTRKEAREGNARVDENNKEKARTSNTRPNVKKSETTKRNESPVSKRSNNARKTPERSSSSYKAPASNRAPKPVVKENTSRKQSSSSGSRSSNKREPVKSNSSNSRR